MARTTWPTDLKSMPEHTSHETICQRVSSYCAQFWENKYLQLGNPGQNCWASLCHGVRTKQPLALHHFQLKNSREKLLFEQLPPRLHVPIGWRTFSTCQSLGLRPDEVQALPGDAKLLSPQVQTNLADVLTSQSLLICQYQQFIIDLRTLPDDTLTTSAFLGPLHTSQKSSCCL